MNTNTRQQCDTTVHMQGGKINTNVRQQKLTHRTFFRKQNFDQQTRIQQVTLHSKLHCNRA